MANILILNLPGRVLKSGSRWYNRIPEKDAQIRYYPYPFFMGYAASLLKSKGVDVDFKDAVAMEWSARKTYNYIADTKPKYIFCEPTWTSLKEDTEFISNLDRGIVKTAIGNFATNFPLEAIRHGFDYAIAGEYEFPILNFLQNGRLPINFISRDKKEYSYPELIKDLDVFPFPERDMTPIGYYNEPSCFGRNIVMVSSRGCRLKCNFCNVEGFYGQHIYRTRSAENVVNEMEYLRGKYKFDEIYFDDDNMVSKKEHIDGICGEIMRRRLEISWLCMGDGFVDDETLELLAAAGCKAYKFGVEHLDSEVLKAIPKPLQKDRIADILRKCRRLGMKSYITLMVGLVNSNARKDMDMIRQAIRLNPDFLQFAISTPYPGTIFNRQARQSGWLVTQDTSSYDVSGSGVVSYPDYSADEITKMYHLAWNIWRRHVMLKKPRILLFFLLSNIKREGLAETIKKSLFYILDAL